MDGVIALSERIEKLVHGNGLALVVPLLELATLQHLRDVVAAREADPAQTAKFAQPSAVEIDDGPLRVQELEDLRAVRLGVPIDLLACQRRPGLGSAARVPDERSEITDEKDHV